MADVLGLFRQKPRQASVAESQKNTLGVHPVSVRGSILDTYRIPAGGAPNSSAEVLIVEVEEASMGRYLVRVPSLNDEERSALTALRVALLAVVPSDATGSPDKVVEEFLWQAA